MKRIGLLVLFSLWITVSFGLHSFSWIRDSGTTFVDIFPRFPPDPNYFMSLQLSGPPPKYVIVYGETLDITGSAEVIGNVGTLSGTPPDTHGKPERLKGYYDHAAEPPVCCVFCSVPGNLPDALDLNIGNKEIRTIAQNAQRDKITIGNGGELIIDTGQSSDILYLKVNELSIKGTMSVIGYGQAILHVVDDWDLDGIIKTAVDPSQLTIIFSGSSFSTQGGIVSGMLCFEDTVREVTINGNFQLTGALSAPEADFKINGTIKITQWFYGKTFDISGNATVIDTPFSGTAPDYRVSYGSFYVLPEGASNRHFDSSGHDLSQGFPIIFEDSPMDSLFFRLTKLWKEERHWNLADVWSGQGYSMDYQHCFTGDPNDPGSAIRALYLYATTYDQAIRIENRSKWELIIGSRIWGYGEVDPFSIPPFSTAVFLQGEWEIE